jgi:hypothetical protein
VIPYEPRTKYAFYKSAASTNILSFNDSDNSRKEISLNEKEDIESKLNSSI